MEQEIWREVTQWEEVMTMYLASFEREPFKRGVAEGEKQKALAIASALLNKGFDPESISQCTGLSLDEIELLAKQAS